jgi:hypothetical protein
MASTINASTSGAGGVITTADASGVLNIQTASTTAMSISAAQVVSLTNALPVTSGGTGLTALGSANQVLAVNSGGTALAFSTPATGAMTLISTQTASSSVITFTGLTGYNHYFLVFKNLQCSAQLYLQVSTNSGSSYITSGYTYNVNAVFATGNGSSSFYNYSTADTFFALGGIYNNPTTGGFGCSGTANITGLLSNYCSVTGQSIVYFGSAGNQHELDNFAGSQTTSQTINALKLSAGGGSFVSGTASLYGISS